MGSRLTPSTRRGRGQPHYPGSPPRQEQPYGSPSVRPIRLDCLANADLAERPVLRARTTRRDVVWPFATRLFEARVAADRTSCAAQKGFEVTLCKTIRSVDRLRMLRILPNMGAVAQAAIQAAP
jgi:hypothetical protein